MTARTDPSPPHDVRPIPFALALSLAPILPGVAFFWLYIPAFAVIFGGGPWLIAGGPALWRSLRIVGSGAHLLLSASLANLIGTPLLTSPFVALVEGPEDVVEIALFSTGFGLVFAPLWAIVFWWLYRWLTGDRRIGWKRAEDKPVAKPRA